MHPVLLIHGGAGSKPLQGQRLLGYRKSLESVLTAVYPRLLANVSAVEAAVHAAALLEDDPLYNAGRGSKIQRDGHIRMSAALMDGATRRFAGCVNVEGVKNPIHLARMLMKQKDRVLSGNGAKAFARENNLPFRSPFTAAQRAAYRARKGGQTGTIGVVALDAKGRLAAATSTGGRGFEHPFRVSDSPTVAGCFADSKCAVSVTGIGEQIVENAVAARLCAWVEAGMSLKKAVAKMMASARSSKSHFGLVALNSGGQIFAATSTSCLIWASASRGGFELP